ncbi:MAG: hypothetical protein IJV78_03775 [Clostridia bacterium]|nr:hypothetical protein [Clostridia bacterium]MBR7176643.1 hypothetical protein [Clostridia bacterium]
MQQHSISYSASVLTLQGVTKVNQITPTEGIFTTEESTVVVKGTDLNIAKLDNQSGCVVLQVATLISITYRSKSAGLKGLFR